MVAEVNLKSRKIDGQRNRVKWLALERLESRDGKLSCAVLRGRRDRKVSPLPDPIYNAKFGIGHLCSGVVCWITCFLRAASASAYPQLIKYPCSFGENGFRRVRMVFIDAVVGLSFTIVSFSALSMKSCQKKQENFLASLPVLDNQGITGN